MHPLFFGIHMSIVPVIDYGSAEYNMPGDATTDLYKVIDRVKVEDFTECLLDGSGVFDVMMKAVSVHLREEFNSNRITGTEYTKAYIASVNACLSTAVQFMFTREQTYWEAVKGQAAAITARVGLQTAKYQTETAKYQTEAAKEQVEQIIAQTALLGQQKLYMMEQTETQRAQTLGTRKDGQPVSGVIGAQVSLYNQQVTSYQRDAEVKATKLFTDAWITQKTMDEGLLPPSNFANASLDSILSSIKVKNGLV